ncbi:MAG: DUF1385 domain-containing protein [Eubacterium sp.]|nr:DUF1385 domain-containing protein [Eubacterium sp.]
MRYSGIGGQAVLEGVMMKNADQYAVAVRRPDHEIEVMTKEYSGLTGTAAKKIPIVRGVLSFIDSMVLGISTLLYSSTFYEDEEETGQKKKQTAEENGPHEVSKSDKAFMGVTTVISFVIAIAIFVILPYYLSQLFQKAVPNSTAVAVFEGVLRLVIFILYIYIISRSKDIQRVFMYHGAEHKCINCIEHGLDLTVENVRISSKEHKRCGTSFLMFVVILSIILFLFIRVDSHTMRIVIRLILVPVIAGISYEVLRLAGKYDNALINAISKPGLALQHMTTKEPDDEMIEVGIASVEAVFDWRSYVEEYRQQEPSDSCQTTCY